MSNNFFENITPDYSKELFYTLFENKKVLIEKIVSAGQVSPTNFWYDQDTDEWLIILDGSTTIEFEDQLIELKKGDSYFIPAHLKHRVSSAKFNTIILAVHLKN